MEPITVNTDITYFKKDTWAWMSYVTIYSALWENTACILQLYNESEKPQQFVRNYSIISILFAVWVTAGCGMAYSCFGQQLKPVIFLNLMQDRRRVKILTGLFTLPVMGSYALMCFPVFTCFKDFTWFKESENPHKCWISRLLYMFIALNVSIFFHDLTALFQLTGPIYSLMLQTILPVLFYIKSY